MIECGDRIACANGECFIVPETPVTFVDRWSAVIGHEIKFVRKAVPSIDLSDLVGGVPGVVAGMLDDPAIQRSANVLPAIAAQVAYQTMHKRFLRAAELAITDELKTKLSEFEQMNGPHPNHATPGNEENAEYEETADAVVEGVVMPYRDVLTNDFIGRYTIDTQVWKGPEQVTRIAQAFAKTVWQSLTWYFPARDGEAGRPETPTETLNRLGVTEAVIRAALDAKVAYATPEPILTVHMDDFIRRARHAFGGADPVTRRFHFEDCLNGMMDTDDILAERDAKLMFDGTREDVEFVRAYGREHGAENGVAQLLEIIDSEDDPADYAEPKYEIISQTDVVAEDLGEIGGSVADDDWMSALAGSPELAPVQATPVTVAPAEDDWMSALAGAPAAVEPEKRRPGRKPKDPALAGAPTGPSIDATTLAKIKDNTHASDSELGDLMGCSRTTWNNYIKGKGTFVPSIAQRDALRSFIEARRAQLDELEGLV